MKLLRINFSDKKKEKQEILKISTKEDALLSFAKSFLEDKMSNKVIYNLYLNNVLFSTKNMSSLNVVELITTSLDALSFGVTSTLEVEFYNASDDFTEELLFLLTEVEEI